MRYLLTFLLLAIPSAASSQIVNWGDHEDNDQTIYLYFNTVGTDGVAETLAGTPDVEIYEDGGTTEIDGGGETLTADFDTVTGLNQVSVDLSNAAYEAGKTYTVVIDAGTVDSVSVVGRVVGVFTVERYATVNETGGVVQANIIQVDDDATAADNLETALDNYSATRGLAGTALPAAVADAVGGLPISDAGGLDLDAILADTNELQADDVPGLIATAQSDLDTLTGTDGVTLATSQPNYAPNTTTPPTAAAIRTEIDNNSTQLAAIVADTNELQGDWTNAGRLDTILDSILADTAAIETVTTAIGATGSGLSAVPWTSWSDTVDGETMVDVFAYLGAVLMGDRAVVDNTGTHTTTYSAMDGTPDRVISTTNDSTQARTIDTLDGSSP